MGAGVEEEVMATITPSSAGIAVFTTAGDVCPGKRFLRSVRILKKGATIGDDYKFAETGGATIVESAATAADVFLDDKKIDAYVDGVNIPVNDGSATMIAYFGMQGAIVDGPPHDGKP
jgi:hypothetical protein